MERRWPDALAAYVALLEGDGAPRGESAATHLAVGLLRRRLGGEAEGLAEILRVREESGASILQILNGRELLGDWPVYSVLRY